MARQVNFRGMRSKLDSLSNRLPRLLANEMLNHTKKAFRDQGFTDKAVDPWAARKRKNKADRNTSASRAILIDSGNLRRSIRIRRATFRETAVGSYGIPYASRHNRGLFGMPKRKFVGRSHRLTKRMREVSMRELKKAFKA